MNKIAAVVKSVDNMGIASYITVETNGIQLQIMKSKTPQWLHLEDSVLVTFQELSVCIGTACDGKVSIGNRIPAKLIFVRTKKNLCELVFQSEVGEVVSMMTEKNFNQLQIAVGSKATILLRDIDISIEPNVETHDVFKARTKVAN